MDEAVRDILDALRELGIDGRCEGRNDLTLNGMKFSGTAVCKRGTRILEHGTLLFDASVERLAAALRPRPEKFSGKAVKSVIRRVCNLSEHLTLPIDVQSFMEFIADHVGAALNCIPYEYNSSDIEAIGRLRDELFGNPEWNFSAPHGAGRIMSRRAAKDQLSMEEYRETMKGVYTTSVNPSTLDEAPMAYKSLEDIIDVIGESVDIIDVMKPIYNFKASD